MLTDFPLKNVASVGKCRELVVASPVQVHDLILGLERLNFFVSLAIENRGYPVVAAAGEGLSRFIPLARNLVLVEAL